MNPDDIKAIYAILERIENHLGELNGRVQALQRRNADHETRLVVLELDAARSVARWRKIEGIVIAVLQAITIALLLASMGLKP